MTIQELIKSTEVLRVIGDTSKPVRDIQFDSRRVGEGSLFVAQVGTAADGHTYIEQCVAKGAVAVVLEREEYIQDNGVCYILVKNSDEALGKMAHYWYGEPSKRLQLVGVTGTNGKTTTATLLYKLFKALGYKVGLLSTVVNYVNEEEVAATHTTPNALELNALLAKMVAAGCTHAFMEVSSHAIAQERIAGLEYAGALFTNLTRDHLDYHKTFDNYRDTKKLLFDRLGKEAFAITNIDDRNGLVMTQNCPSRVLTYSTHSMADFRGKILEEGFDQNTQVLMENYQTIVWVVQNFPDTIAEELNEPFEEVDNLIERVDLEFSLENQRLENRIRSIAKSRVLIDRVNEALTMLRTKPGDGEEMYQVI